MRLHSYNLSCKQLCQTSQFLLFLLVLFSLYSVYLFIDGREQNSANASQNKELSGLSIYLRINVLDDIFTLSYFLKRH